MTGSAKVGLHHAGVDPGCSVLCELRQELDSILDEQCAVLLQPRPFAAVAHVNLGVQQEVPDLSICRDTDKSSNAIGQRLDVVAFYFAQP